MSSQIMKALVPTAGDIAPQSVAAAGTASTGWIDAGQATNFITRVNLGVLGGGTVTLTYEQANTSGGGAAKALAWTGGSSAVNNANIETDNKPEALDINNGFTHFRATLTNVGGTGALVSAIVEAASPRYTS